MILPSLKRSIIVALYLFIVSSVSKAEDDVKDTILIVPDTGRRLRLGDLYDARSDIAMPGKLWKAGTIVNDYIYETPGASTKIDHISDDNFSSRLDLLDISVSAKFRYTKAIARLDINGSFRYLSEKRENSKSIIYTAKFRTRTKRQSIDVFNDDLITQVNQRHLDSGRATHFVSSVTWGSDVYVEFQTGFDDIADKSRIEVGLSGALSLTIGPPLSFEVEGKLNMTKAMRDVKNSTTIKIFGDVKMDTIPRSFDEATAFFKDLPLRVNPSHGDPILDNNGVGVPMEITLSPLSWIDSKAAKASRRVAEETLEGLMQIYDVLEESEVRIEDARSLPYGGFIAWYTKMNKYYNDFKAYQDTLMAEINTATLEYMSGEDGMDDFAPILTGYWDVNNPHNIYAINEKCEEREDELRNLLALSSQFLDAGITFAEHLSDFYEPTFERRFDRVYGLVIVGMNPRRHREAITLIRDFVDLAAAHKQESGNHCVVTNRSSPNPSNPSTPTTDDEVSETPSPATNPTSNPTPSITSAPTLSSTTNDQSDNEPDSPPAEIPISYASICTETEAFVVIHFDSYCSDFCDTDFCDIDSSFKGDCGTNLHDDIQNVTNAFSDCWCESPKTQILQFEGGKKPFRIDSAMPRVPMTPSIKDIVGTHEMEPLGKNQKIQLEIDDIDTNGRNWKITVENQEPVVSDNGDVDFFNQQRVIYTDSTQNKVVIYNLRAGETYDISIAGENGVGVGRAVEEKGIQVGHRMVDLEVMKVQNTLEMPSWLPVDLKLTLSVKTFTSIFAVTIHDKMSIDSVDKWLYDNSEHTSDQVAVCGNLEPKEFEGASCVIQGMNVLQNSTIMEFRVWDDTDLLIAKNKINVLAPSSVSCKKYGEALLFCPFTDPPICVEECNDCSLDLVVSGDTCAYP